MNTTRRHRTGAHTEPAGDPQADLVLRYLSVGEVANRLAVSERTVRREIARGHLPAKRIGRILRIDPHDLAVFDYQASPRRRPQSATARTVTRAPVTATERAAERRRQIMREAKEYRGRTEATGI